MGLCACRGRVAAPAPAGCFEQGGRTASSCLPNPWLLQHIQKTIRTRAPLSHPRAHRLRPSRLIVAGPANLHVALRQGLHTAPWRGCSFRRLHVTRTAEGKEKGMRAVPPPSSPQRRRRLRVLLPLCGFAFVQVRPHGVRRRGLW